MPIIAAESTKRLSIVTGASIVSGVCAAIEDVLLIIKIIRAIYPSAMNAFKYGFLIILCIISDLYGPCGARLELF